MGNILSVIVINIIQNINYQYQEYYYMDAGIYGIKNKINGELIYMVLPSILIEEWNNI